MNLRPDEAGRYNDRAILHLELGNIDPALADWEHCLAIDPEYLACYFDRAWAFDSFGDFDAAVANFRRYLEMGDPGECPPCFEEAEIYISEHSE